MRPYLSIDIETTGLDPDKCCVIEFAAVLDDLERPLEECPVFQAYIYQEVYTGEPYALSMHPGIFRKIAEKDVIESGHILVPASQLCMSVYHWLQRHGVYSGDWEGRITPAGKNFSSFDLTFLKRLPNWDLKLHHRAIDPGNLYWNPELDGPNLPNTETCMKRAGIAGPVAHTALADALVVCKLIRNYINEQTTSN